MLANNIIPAGHLGLWSEYMCAQPEFLVLPSVQISAPFFSCLPSLGFFHFFPYLEPKRNVWNVGALFHSRKGLGMYRISVRRDDDDDDVHWLICLVGLKPPTRHPMALWTTSMAMGNVSSMMFPLILKGVCVFHGTTFDCRNSSVPWWHWLFLRRSWVFISLFALKIYSDPFEGKTTKGEILMFCVLLTEDQKLFFSADRSMSLRYLQLWWRQPEKRWKKSRNPNHGLIDRLLYPPFVKHVDGQLDNSPFTSMIFRLTCP